MTLPMSATCRRSARPCGFDAGRHFVQVGEQKCGKLGACENICLVGVFHLVDIVTEKSDLVHQHDQSVRKSILLRQRFNLLVKRPRQIRVQVLHGSVERRPVIAGGAQPTSVSSVFFPFPEGTSHRGRDVSDLPERRRFRCNHSYRELRQQFIVTEETEQFAFPRQVGSTQNVPVNDHPGTATVARRINADRLPLVSKSRVRNCAHALCRAKCTINGEFGHV